ncbi:MAG: methionine synthase [Bacteroidales bacterium]|nr:methionine synthase [Bacteroidales bacterium]
MTLQELIARRIVILDGAMGSMLQRGFGEEDVLKAYVEAGADIITTNSFSAIRLTQEEFGRGDEAPRMAYEAALRARRIADEAGRQVFVAGSVSSTGKSLTLPSDSDDTSLRSVDFDRLCADYREQISALINGGVDLILLETCFDALNAKAAIYAIESLGQKIPVIISVTVSDRSGRTLTGQTLEAFYTSVKHCPGLAAFGINCALGAEAMASLVSEIASFSSHPLIFYPNAGIPDEMGNYNDTPEQMAAVMRSLAGAGLLNIAGGCCGTASEHIRAIASALKGIAPRRVPARESRLTVSGLECFSLGGRDNFANIGERSNVAGSRKFARLISSNAYAEAIEIAAAQIEGGANIIDVNMDDPMVDSTEKMRVFLRHISADPSVAKAAVMIDSSHWDTIVEGLKNAPGKCIVNSISLKDGEEEFLRRARVIRDFGAAMVVMAFDEKGQAETFERKIEICRRSYELLTSRANIPPEDIIFDCNILSIGTGIAEHSRFGVDFIEAVRWIKQNLPGALTSGGVSNFSFAFRGNNKVREAMHAVFLYHAINAGMDMAIVNPQMLQIYDEVEPQLRRAVEDVIFDSDPEATSRLISIASELLQDKDSAQDRSSAVSEEPLQLDPSARLSAALVKGNSAGLEKLTLECLSSLGSAVQVIEGPLMAGMEKVGELFGAGKMFLPQVVKSARIMRDAVSVLQPYMKGEDNGASKRPRVVIATVQGDVHDIGKNITGIVLQCSGFEVIDLGVMVPSDEILDKAQQLGADIIGVSGLITPSLQRMEEICRKMKERGMTLPLFVGGAAASAVHTAVKLAPLYDNVHYACNASAAAVLAKKYIAYPEDVKQSDSKAQLALRTLYESGMSSSSRTYVKRADVYPDAGIFADVPLTEVGSALLMPFFDWKLFGAVCGLKDPDREAVSGRIDELKLSAFVCAKFFDCRADGDDIVGEGIYLPTLRDGASLSDFYSPDKLSPLGIFAVKVDCPADEDLTDHAIRVTLAEAASAYLSDKFSKSLPSGMKLIMPGIGYSCCPDHSLKRDVLALLPIDIELTDSCAMIPEASVCGFVIAGCNVAYHDIRHLSPEALEDYARRRGMSPEDKNLFLGHFL